MLVEPLDPKTYELSTSCIWLKHECALTCGLAEPTLFEMKYSCWVAQNLFIQNLHCFYRRIRSLRSEQRPPSLFREATSFSGARPGWCFKMGREAEKTVRRRVWCGRSPMKMDFEDFPDSNPPEKPELHS